MVLAPAASHGCLRGEAAFAEGDHAAWARFVGSRSSLFHRSGPRPGTTRLRAAGPAAGSPTAAIRAASCPGAPAGCPRATCLCAAGPAAGCPAAAICPASCPGPPAGASGSARGATGSCATGLRPAPARGSAAAAGAAGVLRTCPCPGRSGPAAGTRLCASSPGAGRRSSCAGLCRAGRRCSGSRRAGCACCCATSRPGVRAARASSSPTVGASSGPGLCTPRCAGTGGRAASSPHSCTGSGAAPHSTGAEPGRCTHLIGQRADHPPVRTGLGDYGRCAPSQAPAAGAGAGDVSAGDAPRDAAVVGRLHRNEQAAAPRG
jgi:hypothetical protein